MKDHFEKVLEDRLVILHNYRTIHMIMQESSPLSGEFFLSVLKLVQSVDDKSKFRPLLKDRSVAPDNGIQSMC